MSNVPLSANRALLLENVPAGRCTCRCRRCGSTVRRPTVHRSTFADPEVARGRVRRALRQLEHEGRRIDCVSIAPQGEPTLDRNLGALIDALHTLELRVVVSTNGTLLHRDDVRRELRRADVVVIDVDAADAAAWHALRHPTAETSFRLVHQGLRVFSAAFEGPVITTTRLVDGVNTTRSHLEGLADLCDTLDARASHLVASNAEPPSSAQWTQAKAIFVDRVREVHVGDALPTTVEVLSLVGGTTQNTLRAGRPAVDAHIASGT